jgi:ABC-2 type transport system ATP-binding protein
MVKKTVGCPKCKTHIEIQGNPGETKIIICPNCKTKGKFTFPGEKTKIETPSPSGSFSIEIENLTKKFKDFKAVDNVSFKVRKGEIFGFLGPNGAGKTTTIKSILGLIHKNSGTIKINGYNITKNSIESKKDIGYLPERVSFYDNITPLQTLNFFCELKQYDKSIIKSLIKEVGLEDAMNRKVGTFSKGMVQLLGVAQVMIGNPSVFILDEPMAGLDARWVKIIREKIKMLNEQGATILFSSHILSEVENICDRVAIIYKGKLIAEDTISNISKYLQMKPRLKITIDSLDGKIPDVISNLEGVENVESKENNLFVTCETNLRSKVITTLEKEGYKIVNIKTIEPTLEDAFVKLIEGGS